MIPRTYGSSTEQYQPLTREETIDLTNKVRLCSSELREQALEEIIKRNRGLVASQAKQYAHFGYPFEDLMQDGNIGLIIAAQKFNPNFDTRFSTYATWWIKQAMLKSLHDNMRIIRVPAYIQELQTKIIKTIDYLLQNGSEPSTENICQRLKDAYNGKVSIKQVKTALQLPEENRTTSINEKVGGDGDTNLEYFIPNPKSEDPSKSIMVSDFRDKVQQAVGGLSPKEQLVLNLRYGLIDDEQRTIIDIASITGLTDQGVRIVMNRALKKLRRNKNLVELNHHQKIFK